MTKADLYEDLTNIITSYQYHGVMDFEESNVDASDLYKVLARIYANWESITAD